MYTELLGTTFLELKNLEYIALFYSLLTVHAYNSIYITCATVTYSENILCPFP